MKQAIKYSWLGVDSLKFFLSIQKQIHSHAMALQVLLIRLVRWAIFFFIHRFTMLLRIPNEMYLYKQSIQDKRRYSFHMNKIILIKKFDCVRYILLVLKLKIHLNKLFFMLNLHQNVMNENSSCHEQNFSVFDLKSINFKWIHQ